MSRTLRCVALFLAGALLAGGTTLAAAQGVGPDYVISPGDVLTVFVYGDSDLSRDYPVGPAGTINLALLGPVNVADLTLAQAQSLLTERLKSLLRLPRVQVGLNETASNRKVYVLGYVTTQGPILMPFASTVLDALAAAGTTDLSDLRQVQLTHPGGQPIALDLRGLRTGARLPAVERLRYGDIVYVPQLEDRVAVLGLVRTPGSQIVPLGQEVTVLDAIARIGGGLLQDAAPGQAMLLRAGGPVMTIDLEALLQRGDPKQNVKLQAGDALVVQQSDNISIVGEVNKPVTLNNAGTITVLEALAQAQGFTPLADLAKARIVSAGGASRPVDIEALWERGDLSQNLRLSPGDVLLMPKQPPQNLLIVGAVERPGVVDLLGQKQTDLLRVVVTSGVREDSDLTRIKVFRGNEALAVNVDAVQNGDLAQNLKLKPDDVVLVPKKDMVYVFGNVGKQGAVPWDTRLRLFDAISQAGGLGQRANENGTVLIRTIPGPVCKTETIKIPMGNLGKGRNCPENIPLQAGDVIYVPTLPERGALLGTLQSLLWAATTVATLTD